MAFSKEVIIDELAQAAGQDPVDFRLSAPRQASAARGRSSGWSPRRPAGTKPFSKEKGRGRGVAVHESFGSVVAQVAEVTVSGDKIARRPRGVRGGLRHRRDAGCGQGADAKRHRLRAVGGAHWARSRSPTGTSIRPTSTSTRCCASTTCRGRSRCISCPRRNPPSGVGEPGTPPIAPGGGQRGACGDRDQTAHAAVRSGARARARANACTSCARRQRHQSAAKLRASRSRPGRWRAPPEPPRVSPRPATCRGGSDP